MGGRYLVTMIPGRMEMYWGSVLMCATYMAMFWGITLWLAVCVWSVASVVAALDPELAEYVSDVCETSWPGNSQTGINTIGNGQGVLHH